MFPAFQLGVCSPEHHVVVHKKKRFHAFQTLINNIAPLDINLDRASIIVRHIITGEVYRIGNPGYSRVRGGRVFNTEQIPETENEDGS
jgi:hypothetical protein